MDDSDLRQITEKLQITAKVDIYEDLVLHLAKKLRQIMSQNPEKLFQMFYLLDVSEAKVKATIDNAAPATIHADLARLIIERELQRIKARKPGDQ